MDASSWIIACRDEALRQIGSEDLLSAMRAIGVQGVEVMIDFDGHLPHIFGLGRTFTIGQVADVRELQRRFDDACLTITSFCLLNEFDQRADAEIDFIRRVVDVAAAHGVPVIRLDYLPRVMKDYDAYVKLAADVARRIIAATGDAPVCFGIENHVTTTNRVDFLRTLLDAAGSTKMGLTLDTANFYWFGHPLSKLYEIYTEFAGRVCHTHCKSIAYPASEREKQRPMGWEYERYACAIDKGDIDFRRVIRILRDAGYRGDLCLENESLGKATPEMRRGTLAREVAYLEQIVNEEVAVGRPGV